MTGLHVGWGIEASSLVATSSLDGTAKLRRLGDGALLASASLPVPLLCLVLDAGEHSLFAGGTDGAVYEVSLLGEPPAGADDGPVAGDSWTWGDGQVLALRAVARMTGHEKPVNALAVSLDGETLVSGAHGASPVVCTQPLHRH